jgi:aspartate carbamoyltransferase regulatory subunit
MNITKIENGFTVDGININRTLKVVESVEILSPTECHIPTENAIIFFDTTVTIGGQTFETIEEWIAHLYA